MVRIYQILLPLFSLFLVRVDLTDLIPLRIKIRSLTLLDADTAQVQTAQGSFRVRLSKLDAPEKGQRLIGFSGDAGKLALKCAEGVLSNFQPQFLRLDKKDIYGRWLGDVDDFSLRLLRNGCSGLYPHAQFSSRKEKHKYLQAYLEARRQRRGVWSKGGWRQPKLWRKESRKRSARRR